MKHAETRLLQNVYEHVQSADAPHSRKRGETRNTKIAYVTAHAHCQMNEEKEKKKNLHPLLPWLFFFLSSTNSFAPHKKKNLPPRTCSFVFFFVYLMNFKKISKNTPKFI